jgi:hypothetical protein
VCVHRTTRDSTQQKGQVKSNCSMWIRLKCISQSYWNACSDVLVGQISGNNEHADNYYRCKLLHVLFYVMLFCSVLDIATEIPTPVSRWMSRHRIIDREIIRLSHSSTRPSIRGKHLHCLPSLLRKFRSTQKVGTDRVLERYRPRQVKVFLVYLLDVAVNEH